MKFLFSKTFFLIYLLVPTALSNILDPLQSQNRNSEEGIKQLGAVKAVQVQFEPKEITVSNEQYEKIEAAVNEVRNQGTIREIKIVAWSDIPYPPAGKKVPDDEIELAQERADRLAGFISSNLGVDRMKLKTYNMAKRPNGFQEFLKTSDALLKEQIQKTKLDPSIRINQPSQALIFIYL